MPPRGYRALTAASFAKLDDQEAEQLVRSLVRAEFRERFGTSEPIEGPPKKHASGADLRVIVPRTPPRVSRTSFEDKRTKRALGSDDAGRAIVYSVKSGAKWREHASAEAQSGSDWALEALARGGHLVLVTTKGTRGAPPQPTALTLEEQLAQHYFVRLQAADPHAADPIDRIHIFDANDLNDYVQETGYTLPTPLRQKLGIPEFTKLLDFAQWDAAHSSDRINPPAFVEDEPRRAAQEQLRTALQGGAESHDRAVWLVGPPGVGKTRLALESLRIRKGTPPTAPDFAARTFFAREAEIALSAIDDDALFEVYKDAILVVDDCSTADAQRISKRFVQSQSGASLILITPLAEDARGADAPRAGRIDVPAMDRDSSRTLLRRELNWDESDPRLAAVLDQTKGYPWFAMLVARDLAKDPNAPPPTSLSEAVDLALCPPGPDFSLTVRLRAAALFAVMLLDGGALEDVDEDDREEMRKQLAFASWIELTRTADACKERGLIRTGIGGIYKYVTPAIIELNIAERFLGPPPEPPVPGRARLQFKSANLRGKLDALARRLENLSASPVLLAHVAAASVDALEAAPATLSSLSHVSLGGIEFAARHQPQRTATTLRRIIEGTSTEELRQDHVFRRSLVFALDAIAERRHTFDDVEASLFRLSLTENETFSNSASASWAGLFDITLNTTYLSFEERLPSLSARLASPTWQERRCALAALKRVTAGSGTKFGGHELDGPYPRPTRLGATQSAVTAWKLLLDRLRDEHAEVRNEATAILVRNLRTAVRSGLLSEIGPALIEHARDIPESERHRVVETLGLANAYDTPQLQLTQTEEMFASVRAAFAPSTYGERLRVRAGTWGPVAFREAYDVDRELAREGLAPPEPLLAELGWLLSPKAARAIAFLRCAGEVDFEEKLLRPLLDHAVEDPFSVSSYLAGRESAGADQTVADAIARFRNAGQHDAAAITIWRCAVTEARVDLLLEDLGAGRLGSVAVSTLGVGTWSPSLPVERLVPFIDALLNHASKEAILVALSSMHDREAWLEHFDPSHDLLARVFSAACSLDISDFGYFAHPWKEVGVRLAHNGSLRRVAELTCEMVLRSSRALPSEEIPELLLVCATLDGSSTWNAIVPLMESPSVHADVLAHVIGRWGVIGKLPEDAISDWVGRDRLRGERVAALLSLHGESVPPLARTLLSRFGPDSAAADILLADVTTTPRAVGSLARFAATMLKRVETWLTDLDPTFAAFARRAQQTLEADLRVYGAQEEHERRRRTGS